VVVSCNTYHGWNWLGDRGATQRLATALSYVLSCVYCGKFFRLENLAYQKMARRPTMHPSGMPFPIHTPILSTISYAFGS